MNLYKVKRNSDGLLAENCPVNVGVKIGSFDCTGLCLHNQNTPIEMEKYGFNIPFINCKEADKLPQESKQLTINI